MTNKHLELDYRADIDGLRALAVLFVVAFHSFHLKGGFIGVDIFFVISGYLITTLLLEKLHKNNFSFFNFYMRRIKRIFPALILVLLSSFILGWFFLLPIEYKQLGKHLMGASAFVSNFLLWQESGYFDAAAKTKPLLHLWSLGIEEQFYIFWPLLLWIGLKLRFNLLLLISLLAIISFSLNIASIYSDPIATFYSPQTRVWELACGSLLAYFCIAGNTHSFSPTHQNILSFFGILGIIYCVFGLDKKINFPGYWAMLPTLCALLIIAAGNKTWLNRKVLAHPILVWIGLISFPLYLWHWPLLVFADLFTDPKNFSHHIIKLIAVLLSFLLAALTYRFVEKPMRYDQYNLVKITFLSILMAFSGYIGYQTFLKQGFNQRVPELLQIGNQKNQTKYPMNTCFLEPNQSYTQFGDCGLTRSKNKKTILIWGDSHAAHLYAGYKAALGDSVNLLVRTAAGCPPVMNAKEYHTKVCKEINEQVMQLALKEKPDKVVLSGVWTHQPEWFKLSQTISQLKSAGITDIDLIGPDPSWTHSLPRQLFAYSKQNKEKKLPERMHLGLVVKFLDLDKSMRAFAEKEKVHYLSPASILCNEQGCLTHLAGKYLISEDYGHFSEQASIFVVSQFYANR